MWKQDGTSVRTTDGYLIATCCTETMARVIVEMSAQHDALMAAMWALDQCVDDFGETGQSVCLYAKGQAIDALAKCRAAGIDMEEKT